VRITAIPKARNRAIGPITVIIVLIWLTADVSFRLSFHICSAQIIGFNGRGRERGGRSASDRLGEREERLVETPHSTKTISSSNDAITVTAFLPLARFWIGAPDNVSKGEKLSQRYAFYKTGLLQCHNQQARS
jgi:hypothetical protein